MMDFFTGCNSIHHGIPNFTTFQYSYCKEKKRKVTIKTPCKVVFKHSGKHLQLYKPVSHFPVNQYDITAQQLLIWYEKIQRKQRD